MIHAMSMITFLEKILPEPPVGTPNELAQGGIDFFALWISRIGGIVAFIGAIKLALALNNDDAKDQLQSIMIMVSGFMVKAAVGSLDIFKIPAVYTTAAANAEFKAIMDFMGDWIRRVGAFGFFIGAFMFALAIKDNNAVTKITGLRTLSAGAMITAVSMILPQFV